MFGKPGRPMAGHDLLHRLLLHKSPRPIARRALVIGEESFDGVVIQRGHSVPKLSTPRPSYSNLLAGFRSAARLSRSAVGGTIFAQFGKLAARAVGLRRLLSQLGVVMMCLFFF